MPYTFLHPGFIVPFAKWFPRFMSIPALIIGSFVPDLDIIYRFSDTRNHLFSYSYTNIIFTLIPIGVIITYYLEIILIPIAARGKIEIDFNLLKRSVSRLPIIVFCVGVAILLHLYLDRYAHFDDAKGLSLRISENLGYEQSETDSIYKILLYLPQLIISGIGLILTLLSLYLFRKELMNQLHFLFKHRFTTFFLAAFICVSFTSMKVIKAGVEQGMEIDSLLIGMTCGLMSAFLLTPVALWIFLRVPARQHILFPMIYIFSIYMVGLVFKEYLAIYILKGIFVTAFSFISLVVISAVRTDWKIIALLFINLILISVHPFTGYFTYLLIFNFILLLILTLLRNHLPPLFSIVIKGLVTGSMITLAYYASNKGLGFGIVVIYVMAMCNELSGNHLFSDKRNFGLSFVSKLLTCLIIASVKAPLGILAAAILCFITLLQWIFKKYSRENSDFLFFTLTVPLITTVYVAFQFSLLYGIFSASQILFMLMLAYSNQVKSEEETTEYGS